MPVYENTGSPDYAFLRRDSPPFVYAGASNPAAAWFDYDYDGDGSFTEITGSPTGDRSQSSLRAHFGLGDADVVDSLIVEYPSGAIEVAGLPAGIYRVNLRAGAVVLGDSLIIR